jgi:hypothetical protein
MVKSSAKEPVQQLYYGGEIWRFKEGCNKKADDKYRRLWLRGAYINERLRLERYQTPLEYPHPLTQLPTISA